MSFIPFSLFLLALLSFACVPFTSNAISSCNGTCQTLNDCAGQLICINGKCNDDPDVGTHICVGTTPSTVPPPPPSGSTISSCNGPCQTLNDCAGQLICINGTCNDDPDVGTHICTTPVSPPSPPPPSSTRSPPPPPPITTRSPPPPPLPSPPPPPPTTTPSPPPPPLSSPPPPPPITTRSPPPPPLPSPPPPPPTTTRSPPPPPLSSPPPPPPTSGCQSSGTLVCGGVSYPQYSCSPPVTSSTSAILTNNDFSEGGDGGGPSECDGMYHNNTELIVALSTGWYSGGSRCFKMINITSVKTGRTVKAEIIDECDSINGCDQEHDYQPPCRKNIVDGSDAVWSALGLDKNVGEENVTWFMA